MEQDLTDPFERVECSTTMPEPVDDWLEPVPVVAEPAPNPRPEPVARPAPPTPRVPVTLAALIREEGRLAQRGLVCQFKSKDWANPTCIECPIREHAKGMEKLCRIGVQQQELVAA